MSKKLNVTVRYSPSERTLLKLLNKKPQTTRELSEKFFGGREKPFYDRQVIIGLIASLERKTAMNSEAFSIRRTSRAGPKQMSFWVER